MCGDPLGRGAPVPLKEGLAEGRVVWRERVEGADSLAQRGLAERLQLGGDRALQPAGAALSGAAGGRGERARRCKLNIGLLA